MLQDDELQKSFEEKGYVIVPLLTPEEVEEIRSRLFQMKPDDNFEPTDSRYHCSFLDTNRQYKTDCDTLFRTLLVPKLQKILYDYDLVIGNFYVKNPGGSGEFQIHQNWDVVDESKYTSVTAWVPLQDTTRLNGTIEFIEGSHKLYPDIASRNSDYYFANFSEKLKTHYCQPCDMKAGNAVIFDDDMVHYSTANDGPDRRISMQLAFAPNSAQRVFYYLDPAAPEKFDVYETNMEYYLSNNDASKRPVQLKHVYSVPNRNRLVTEEEFVERLKNGKKVREGYYQGKPSQVYPSALSRSVSGAFHQVKNLVQRVLK